MRVLVTGGCGYVGSALLPLLAGNEVAVADLQWFGNATGFPCKPVDYRDLSIETLRNFDAVIHLAAVANDPSSELDPALTWETNALGTMQLADRCAKALVKQFIYASSGSVYGVSDAPEVTEDTELNPLSAYNKTKMVAERCLLSYADRMAVQIVRPATVCGVSPRQRLDVVVNALAVQAFATGRINVEGGKQMRPHIHIQDMARLYVWLLERPHLTGIWNVGFENASVMETAKLIASYIEAVIVERPSNDPRSYRMNSDKLLKAGFVPKHNVNAAIGDLLDAFAKGNLEDTDICHNVRWLKRQREPASESRIIH